MPSTIIISGVTAIRNGDIDGNDATERAASWLPIDNTPMHPEYPCAHCILSGAIAGVIKTALGTEDIPEIAVRLIERPDLEPSVVGETSSIPVVAAVANAIFDATGKRMRVAPFTPERVLRAGPNRFFYEHALSSPATSA